MEHSSRPVVGQQRRSLEWPASKTSTRRIIKEPESAGAEIERKNPGDKDTGEAAVAAKTVSAPNGKASSSADPLSNRRSDARPASGKTPRPTEKAGE